MGGGYKAWKKWESVPKDALARDSSRLAFRLHDGSQSPEHLNLLCAGAWKKDEAEDAREKSRDMSDILTGLEGLILTLPQPSTTVGLPHRRLSRWQADHSLGKSEDVRTYDQVLKLKEAEVRQSPHAYAALAIGAPFYLHRKQSRANPDLGLSNVDDGHTIDWKTGTIREEGWSLALLPTGNAGPEKEKTFHRGG